LLELRISCIAVLYRGYSGDNEFERIFGVNRRVSSKFDKHFKKVYSKKHIKEAIWERS